MSEPRNDRAKLEAAVSKIAKAFEDLVRVVERSGDLTAADLMKANNFIVNAQAHSMRKAELSLTTAKMANGFSLDMEIEPPAQGAIAAPSIHVRSGAVLPGERVFGDKRRPRSKEDDGLLEDVVDPDDNGELAEFLEDEE